MMTEDDYQLLHEMNIRDVDEPIQHGEMLPKTIISPAVLAKRDEWNELVAFLEKWFCEPDVDAFKIVLSVYAAHLYQNDPIWLFVISPPGSGKTSIAIRGLSFLPNTHPVGDININSFLSGYGENNGLLGNLTKNYKGNGVILFPDFTSLLSKRHEQKAEIMGQMRQIYDGYYSKTVGNKSESVFWRGKVTCIAAVTPALENYWGTHRSLGERFLNVRWKQPDGLMTAEFAERQVDHEKEIRDGFEKLVKAYVGVTKDDKGNEIVKIHEVYIEKDRELGLKDLAYIVSLLRTNVTRDSKSRKIVDVDEAESPSRIAKSLAMVAKGSATLDRRASIDASDLDLAHRVAKDSIDKQRGKVMNELLEGKIVNGDVVYEVTMSELVKTTDLPNAALTRVLEDLEILKIIDIEERVDEIWIRLTPKISKCWDNCIPITKET